MPYNVLISKIRCDNPNKKNTAIHNKNHFIYIGTREGTDLTPLELENTEKFEKEMASSQDYVRYIAKRPHSHGLFGNIPLDDINEFSKNIYKLSKQKRNIYRGIVSLDPRDAEDLGYYDKSKWESYVRSTIPDVAKEFGISVDKLQWTAAYHAEARHPHVHYMFWSSEPMVQDPFITEARQNRCRQLLSGKMFREEHDNEVINKEIAENFIMEFGKELSSEEIDKISAMTAGLRHKTTLSQKIPMKQLEKTTEELLTLIPMLPKEGRLYYKLMPPHVKEQINKIADIILNSRSVNETYEKFLDSIDKISLTYSPSIDERKNAKWKDNAIAELRKDLGNVILSDINKQIKIHSEFTSFSATLLDQYHNLHVDDDQLEDIVNESAYESLEENLPDLLQYDDTAALDMNNPRYGINLSGKEEDFLLSWTKRYKSALHELYDTHNYEKTIGLLNIEASAGNVLAIHDLGKLLNQGIGCISNAELATDYYKKAFTGFSKLYATADENSSIKEYIAYRIGKLYDRGNGIEKDKGLAEYWYKCAANNKYAQYSLAKIYISKDMHSGELIHSQQIMNLLLSSSEKNVYASYELGNIFKKGIFTDASTDKSIFHYKIAFDKFNKMLNTNADDMLMYRLGKMHQLGLGTEINLDKAIELYEKAGELKNRFALLSLAQIYSDSAIEGLQSKSIQILKTLYEENPEDDMITYSLGKVYSKQDSPVYNMDQAISYFMESARKNNSFAQLQLGIIYLWGKGVKRDVILGKDFLNQAVRNGNPFAQQVWDSYETYRMQYAMNFSYKLFTNIFETILNKNDRTTTVAAERYFQNLSKKAMIEEQLKNPHKHN